MDLYLNPFKRHRTVEWIRKHDPHIGCLQESHLRTKDLHRLKVKGWKQIFQANGQGKRARVKNHFLRPQKLKPETYPKEQI